jgi:hypothetical protein
MATPLPIPEILLHVGFWSHWNNQKKIFETTNQIWSDMIRYDHWLVVYLPPWKKILVRLDHHPNYWGKIFQSCLKPPTRSDMMLTSHRDAQFLGLTQLPSRLLLTLAADPADLGPDPCPFPWQRWHRWHCGDRMGSHLLAPRKRNSWKDCLYNLI